MQVDISLASGWLRNAGELYYSSRASVAGDSGIWCCRKRLTPGGLSRCELVAPLSTTPRLLDAIAKGMISCS